MPERKNSTLFVALGVVVVLVALTMFTASTIVRRDGERHVNELRADLYERCMQRAEYDAASQDTRRVQREYWIAYIQAERLNTFIDDALRKQRVATAQSMVDSFNNTLASSVTTSCEIYKPAEMK